MRELALESTWDAERLAREERALALVPFGSMEQHCEAPLGSDTIIVWELAKRVCRGLGERGVVCVLLPVVPYGFSPEWGGAPGTVTLSLSTFTGLVRDLLESLWRSGFRRVALLNGHGGNSGLLEATAREWASHRPRALVVVVDYWRAAGLGLGHCCEAEERLLSEALGRRVRCGCSGSVSSVRGARAIRIRENPAGLGMPGRGGVGLEEAAARVVDAVLEALRVGGMSL